MSPFTVATLRAYRSLAALTGVGGLFFLFATQARGFQAGVNAGLGVALCGLALAFLALERYVARRLDYPLEFWRDQQRRLGPPLWRGVGLIVGTGAVVSAFCWHGGEAFLAGIGVGATAIPAFGLAGKVTGQFGSL